MEWWIDTFEPLFQFVAKIITRGIEFPLNSHVEYTNLKFMLLIK